MLAFLMPLTARVQACAQGPSINASTCGLGLEASDRKIKGRRRLHAAEGGSCIQSLEAAGTVVSTVSSLDSFFVLILIPMAWPLESHDSGGLAPDPSFLALPDSLLKLTRTPKLLLLAHKKPTWDRCALMAVTSAAFPLLCGPWRHRYLLMAKGRTTGEAPEDWAMTSQDDKQRSILLSPEPPAGMSAPKSL